VRDAASSFVLLKERGEDEPRVNAVEETNMMMRGESLSSETSI